MTSLAAHLNALESLPVFAAIVAAANGSGKLSLINDLAPFVVYFRVGQSLVHVSGTSQPQVLVRASFFFVQLALLLYMVWVLL